MNTASHPFRWTVLGLLCLLNASVVLARDAACPFLDSDTLPLNSQRIERCFGSYGIELLPPLDGLRVARLYSQSGDGTAWRTLALTGFADDLPPSLAEPMERIRHGASIGSTLSGAGWRLVKTTLLVGEIYPGDRLRRLAGAPDPGPCAPLALHVYRLAATRDGVSHWLARIAEIHQPDYLRMDDVRAIFPIDTVADAGDQAFIVQIERALGRERPSSVPLSLSPSR